MSTSQNRIRNGEVRSGEEWMASIVDSVDYFADNGLPWKGGSGAPGWRRVRPENERNQRTFPPSLRDRRAGGGGGPFRRLRRPVSITLLALRAVRLINHLYKSPTQNAAKCHRKKQTRTKFDFVD